jgi:hypothetical protein
MINFLPLCLSRSCKGLHDGFTYFLARACLTVPLLAFKYSGGRQNPEKKMILWKIVSLRAERQQNRGLTL